MDVDAQVYQAEAAALGDIWRDSGGNAGRHICLRRLPQDGLHLGTCLHPQSLMGTGERASRYGTWTPRVRTQGFAIGTIGGFGTGFQQRAVQIRNAKLQEAKPTVTVSESQQDTYSVYLGQDENGVIKYVGITKRDPEIRFKEHQRSGTERANLLYEVVEGTGHLSKIEAQIIEQNYINTYKMQKNGGLLLNKINSIAPRKWKDYGIK